MKGMALGHLNLPGICPVNQRPVETADRSYGGLFECRIGVRGSYFCLVVSAQSFEMAQGVQKTIAGHRPPGLSFLVGIDIISRQTLSLNR
jgi:hypothetical protein